MITPLPGATAAKPGSATLPFFGVVPEVVDEAIKLKIHVIWMQEGVIHQAAAEKARKAGIFVVMDRCILKEHHKLEAR